jgi:spore coat protein H
MRQSQVIQKLVIISVVISAQIAASAYVMEKGSHRIELAMPDQDQQALKASEKTEVQHVEIKVFSGDKLKDQEIAEISTRGQSSLKKFSRKNFNVKIKTNEDGNKQALKVGKLKAKKLTFSASPEDILFVKNSIGYSLLKEIGIHSLESQFAEVIINGKSEGLYMITENQSENLIKELNADVVFRRRYNDDLELKDAKPELSPQDIALFQSRLRQIHKSIREMHGEQLITTLSKNLNLKNYLKWLAFNYIVKNGDFSDEVYFYGKKTEDGNIMFDISPWDMDDSFSDRMHLSKVPTFPNNGMRDESRKQLLYGYESRIDRKVGGDPELLRLYFSAMEEVVTILSAEGKMDQIHQDILTRLNPYLDDADIQANGKYDAVAQAHTRSKIAGELVQKISAVKVRMEAVKAELEKIKNEDNINYRVLDLSGLRKVLIKIDNTLLRFFTK